MTKERKNPKSFRNGDVIKIATGTGEIVFVKFGDNFYNLSDGGQMKGYKYLPSGRKEIISNLSGLGKYLAMSPEELEREVEGEKRDEGEDIKKVMEEFEKLRKLGDSGVTEPEWELVFQDQEEAARSTISGGTTSTTSKEFKSK